MFETKGTPAGQVQYLYLLLCLSHDPNGYPVYPVWYLHGGCDFHEEHAVCVCVSVNVL